MKTGYEKWTPTEVSSQLQGIGLGNYANEFIRHDIYGEVLPMLQDKHLKALGMNLIGHRIQFMRFVKSLTGNSAAEQQPEPKRSTPITSSNSNNRKSPYNDNNDDYVSPRYRSGASDPFENQNNQYSRNKPSMQQQKKPTYSSYRPQSDEEEEEEEEPKYQYRPYQREQKPAPQVPARKTYETHRDDSDDDYKMPKNKYSASQSRQQNYGNDFDEMDEDAVFNRKPKQNPNQITSNYANQRSSERFNQPYGNSRQNRYDDDEEEEENDYRNNRYSQPSHSRQTSKPMHKHNAYDDDSEEEEQDTYYRPPSRSTARNPPAKPQMPAEDGPTPYADEKVDLVECSICGRKFAADRIDKHEAICRKSANKKKKVFDTTAKRIADTGAENFISQIKAQKEEKPKPKNEVPKYKREHDKLVEAMRNARKIQQYEKDLAAGKDVKPPEIAPIQMDDDDRVTCPICGRKFGKDALARHTPGCEKLNARRGGPRGRK